MAARIDPTVEYCSLPGPIGYSIAAQRNVRAMKRVGMDCRWRSLLGAFASRDRCDVRVLHDAPLRIGERFEALASRSGRTLISTAWETDQVPNGWADILNRADGVVVPCRWNERVLRHCGIVVPIFVTPHPVGLPLDVDRGLWTDRVARRLGLRGDEFIFYTIGNWTSRKNTSELLKTYLDCYAGRRDVVLVIKTSRLADDGPRLINRPLPTTWIARWRRGIAANLPRVVVAVEEWCDEEISALHHLGHCYLSMSHGEGWGLGGFDALSLGTPTIAPRHGGPLDYLGHDWPYLVDVEEVSADARGWEGEIFGPGQHWAEPDARHMAQLMTHVHRNYATALAVTRPKANHILRDYSLDRVGETWRALLEPEEVP